MMALYWSVPSGDLRRRTGDAITVDAECPAWRSNFGG